MSGSKLLLAGLGLFVGLAVGRGTAPRIKKSDRGDPSKVFAVASVGVDGKWFLIQDDDWTPDPPLNGEKESDAWRCQVDGGRVVLLAARLDRGPSRPIQVLEPVAPAGVPKVGIE